MKKILTLILAIAIILNMIYIDKMNVYAGDIWPEDLPIKPSYDELGYPNEIIYFNRFDNRIYFMVSNGELHFHDEQAGELIWYVLGFDKGEAEYENAKSWQLNESGTEWILKTITTREINDSESIYYTNQDYIKCYEYSNHSDVGTVIYTPATVLDNLNEATSITSFNNIWLDNKTELGINNTFLDNYVRYTIGRQSRINEALFNAKPYSSVSEFSTKFTELCRPIYKLITMPEDTTEIFIKNILSVGSIPIQIDWYQADYRSTWTYADGTKSVMQNDDMTDHDDLWEYDAGESELLELLNPIEGKIAIRYEQDIGLFVVFSNYEDGGSSEPPVVGPLQPIEEIHMPQGPNRANYEEGVWGSINYSLDCILYWVGYPFIVLNYLSQRFILYMQSLTNNIGSMGNVMTGMVSWLPPEMIAMLLLGVTVGVIMKILGR